MIVNVIGVFTCVFGVGAIIMSCGNKESEWATAAALFLIAAAICFK